MKRDYLRLSGGGLAAKVLGAAREVLLARFFGTGRVADAYRGALAVTLSPVHLVTTRVVQTCFIPLFARYAHDQEKKGRALFQSLFLVFLGLGGVLGALLYLFAAPLVGIVLRGFDPDRAELSVRMLRIMAVGVPFYMYCSVLGALGAAQKDFVIPSLRPGLQNLGMIVMIVAAARFGAPALAAWGFTGAYVLLAFWATVHLLRSGKLPTRPTLDKPLLRETWGELCSLLRPLVPLSFLIEANVLVERFVSSLLGPGRVAAVDYARFLTETIHFLLAVPIGILGLSFFATLGDDETREQTDRILALLLVALVPISAFLLLNGRGVLEALYMRGRFDETSLDLTERALLGFSAGLWLFSAGYAMQRIANARLRNHVVLRAEALSIGINVVFNLLLFRVLGIAVIGFGLAAGSAASFVYYLATLGGPFPHAKRGATLAFVAAPPYALAALLTERAVGRGAAALLAQIPLFLAYWAIVLLPRKELRSLLPRGPGGAPR